MNSPYFMISLLVSGWLITTAFADQIKKCPDLVVKEIEQPDYDNFTRGTVVVVRVKNIGNMESPKTKVKISDVDISVREAKKMGLEDLYIELIGENNARAKWYGKDNEDDRDNNEFDYDRYVEDIQKIPPIKPGKTYEITFSIEDHWVYDSNCELKVEIDFENNIEECDEKNNIDYFFGWG